MASRAVLSIESFTADTACRIVLVFPALVEARIVATSCKLPEFAAREIRSAAIPNVRASW